MTIQQKLTFYRDLIVRSFLSLGLRINICIDRSKFRVHSQPSKEAFLITSDKRCVRMKEKQKTKRITTKPWKNLCVTNTLHSKRILSSS